MFINIDTDNGITCSEKLSFEDALRLVGSGALTLLKTFEAQLKDELKDDEEKFNAIKGYAYDMANVMFGNILDDFDSERSPGTDLTAQAIMEAENAILDREVPDVPKEETETETDPA